MSLKAVEVLLDETMRAALDEKARSPGLSRSAFVRELVADYVRERDQDASGTFE